MTSNLNEFLTGVGLVAETSLAFYRSALGAGATLEEAMRLLQVYIAAMLWGPPDKKGE